MQYISVESVSLLYIMVYVPIESVEIRLVGCMILVIG